MLGCAPGRNGDPEPGPEDGPEDGPGEGPDDGEDEGSADGTPDGTVGGVMLEDGGTGVADAVPEEPAGPARVVRSFGWPVA